MVMCGVMVVVLQYYGMMEVLHRKSMIVNMLMV